MELSKKYELIFDIYLFNTGSGDNGVYRECFGFSTLETAQGLMEELIHAKQSATTSELLDEKWGIYGYIESIIGIFEVTRKKVV